MKTKQNNFLKLILLSVSFVFMASCEEDDSPVEPVQELLPPIVLDCDFFKEDQILTDDPLRPVDFVVTCWATVKGDLRIEPGVVIEFERHAGLYIANKNKELQIKGAPDQPVILSGIEKQKGFWRGLLFAESHNLNNLIEHSIIEYAGSQYLKPTTPIYRGSLAVQGVSGTTPQTLNLRNVEISNSGNIGLDLHGISKSAKVTTENLNLTKNNGVPVQISAEMTHILDGSSNFQGNVKDFVNITTTNYELQEQNVSWKKLNVPYLIDGRVHIKKNGHLNIEAGANLVFRTNAYLQVAPLLPPYQASLKIVGNSGEPVSLQGYESNFWGGIYLGHTQEDNRIEHAHIKNAKGDFPVGNLQDKGAIYLHAQPKLQVLNSVFEDIPNCAFYGYGTDPFENLTVNNLNFINVASEYCAN